MPQVGRTDHTQYYCNNGVNCTCKMGYFVTIKIHQGSITGLRLWYQRFLKKKLSIHYTEVEPVVNLERKTPSRLRERFCWPG